MTAVSIAALTVYDMVKGVERGVTIGGVRLLAKSGGKSGDWVRQEREAPSAPVHRPGARSAGTDREVREARRSAVSGDGRDEARPRHHGQRSASTQGVREDTSGAGVGERLELLGFTVQRAVLPDERDALSKVLRASAESHDLIVTTGGTGLTPRDVTPQATT